jgi:predicted amidohydrolase YtcJ
MLARYARIMRNIVFALFVLLAAGCKSVVPEVVLTGGKIFTADPERPWAEAVAVGEDRIMVVGSNEEAMEHANDSTRVIELHGRVVVPGINDAHVHEPWGIGAVALEIAEDASVGDVLEAVSAGVRAHPDGTLLRGSIPQELLDDPRLTRETLDALAARHPVMLNNFAGHTELHNSAALLHRGIAEGAPDPHAGWYGRGADGRLNGWVYEYALWAKDRQLAAAMPDEPYAASMRAFAEEAVRYGITSVQSMPGIERDRAVRLAETLDIPLRWRWIDLVMGGVDDAPDGPVKYILDGTPIERGAAMREPYADRPEHSGRVNFDDSELARMVRAAALSGAPLHVHISGDAALEKLFGMMRGAPVDWPSKRVRIEHGDFLAPFLEQARELGVILVQNPSHFMIPGLVHARYDAARLVGYQPARTAVEQGPHFAIGSDGPLNPWLNVMFATMHADNPSEALTVEQAVTAYTRGSAYAEFQEEEKGTLAPGMLADLAVLSQDVFTVPPQELPKTESVLTMIGGKIVYEASGVRPPG